MLRMLFIAVMILTACKKEEQAAPTPTPKTETTTETKPATPPPTAPSDKPGETAQATPAATTGPSCEKLVPAELKDKYFKDMELKQEASGGGTNCTFINAATADIRIYSVMCVNWDDATFQKTMDKGKESMKNAKDLPGVGKTAYMGDTVAGSMVQFRDDDTNCYGTLMAPADQAPDIAKALVAALTPDAIK